MRQPGASRLATCAGALLLATQLLVSSCASPPPPNAEAEPLALPVPEPAPAPPPPLPVSAQPAPPELDGDSLAEWQASFDAQLADETRAHAAIVLLGGTLARGWGESRAFRKQWSDHAVLLLGSPGDQTQQVLFRIEHGVLDGVSPRLVMLLVGNENLARGASAEETALGVRTVVQSVREKLPRAPVLVVGILPAGRQRSDPLRRRIDAANRDLERTAGGRRVLVLDAGGALLSAEGRLSDDLMTDRFEPTPLGYDVLGQTVGLVALGLLRGSL